MGADSVRFIAMRNALPNVGQLCRHCSGRASFESRLATTIIRAGPWVGGWVNCEGVSVTDFVYPPFFMPPAGSCTVGPDAARPDVRGGQQRARRSWRSDGR